MYKKSFSDLEKVAYFVSIQKFLKEIKGVKWRELTFFFDKNSFDKGIETIEEKYNLRQEPLAIFCNDKDANDNANLINQFEIILTKWKSQNINAIIKDNFKKYNAIKNIKNAYFLFYKGNKEILENKSTEFVSVVGSRKTPPSYSKWISKNVPNDKIIVSGLANGADLMGHLYAIKNKQKIVIFPGIDLLYPPKNNYKKRKIWNYAMDKGLIISDIVPGTKAYDKTVFLKRNKWMAQIVNETYSVYFDGLSGTLGQLLEVAKRNGTVYMPREIYKKNENFLREHNAFKLILEKVKIK